MSFSDLASCLNMTKIEYSPSAYIILQISQTTSIIQLVNVVAKNYKACFWVGVVYLIFCFKVLLKYFESCIMVNNDYGFAAL